MNHTDRTPRPLLFVALLSLVLSFTACQRAQAAPKAEPVEAAALLAQINAGTAPLVIDVRTADEYAAGHVPGAVNIPYDQMPVRAAEIAVHKDKEVVLYCRSGRRSGIAAETLAAEGFTGLRLLVGDMPGWERAGYPVE